MYKNQTASGLSGFFISKGIEGHNNMARRDSMSNQFNAGDTVYVIYRNPHAANVAHIKEAEIVHHPYHEGELSLFIYETYHPFAEDDAVFASYEEAKSLYKELFDIDPYE